MIVYFIVLSISLFLFYIGHKRNKWIFKVLSLFILIVFSGCRYMVGIDFVSYWWIYEEINGILIEPGYTAICKVLSNANFGAQLHFFFFSAITLLIIVRGILFYNNKHAVLCLFIYLFAGFYVDSFNIVRQSLAIAIFFWSGKYIINRQLKKYIICILGATCFHMSSITLIPFYYILNRHYSRYAIAIIMVISLLISYYGIIDRFMEYLPIYTKYLESGNEFNVNSNLGLGFYIKYLIGIIMLLAKEKIIDKFPQLNMALNAYFWYLILMGMMQNYLVFLRVAYYFQIFLIIILPALLSVIKKNGSYIVAKGLLICYGCLLLFIQTNDSRSNLLPYRMNFDIYQKELEQ